MTDEDKSHDLLIDALGRKVYASATLLESAEMIIRQRDNLVTENTALRDRIDRCDAVLTQLQDTAKGFEGNLVDEARIILGEG